MEQPRFELAAREEIAEIRRRHKADAAEMERCRESLRAEILANNRAEELVDKLADALEACVRPALLRAQAPGYGPTSGRLKRAEAALKLAGRLP